MSVLANGYLLAMLEEMEKAGSWCGETHLQKCIYLLACLEGVGVLPYEFIMYKHGPYSFDLHDTLGELQSALLIERTATPPYGSRLNNTEIGTKYLQRLERQGKVDREPLRRIAGAFSSLTVSELERLATAAYVNHELPGRERGVRVDRLRTLKPHITRPLAEDSFTRIDEYEDITAK